MCVFKDTLTESTFHFVCCRGVPKHIGGTENKLLGDMQAATHKPHFFWLMAGLRKFTAGFSASRNCA